MQTEPLAKGSVVPGAVGLPKRLPSLDGWRAICIAMVLGSHSFFSQTFTKLTQIPGGGFLTDGILGVRCFFVISGFLITYLMLREYEGTGRISLKDFYIRRALRILPVYSAYLIVVAILQSLTGLEQKPVTWLGDLTFTVNFLPRGPISGHLWSLSVEEQFYLLWPVTLVWLLRGRPRRFWLVFLVPMAVAMVFRAIAWTKHFPYLLHPFFHFHSSFINVDCLDVGCVAAFALVYHEKAVRDYLAGGRFWWVAGGGLMLLVGPHYLNEMQAPLINGAISILGNLLQAVGFAVLLVASVIRPRYFGWLNWGPVAYVGALSYSIYIWQQIFATRPGEYKVADYWWFHMPEWILCSLLAAVISYHCLEKPWLKLRSKFRNN